MAEKDTQTVKTMNDDVCWQQLALWKFTYLCTQWPVHRFTGMTAYRILDEIIEETKEPGPKQRDLADLCIRIAQIPGITVPVIKGEMPSDPPIDGDPSKV